MHREAFISRELHTILPSIVFDDCAITYLAQFDKSTIFVVLGQSLSANIYHERFGKHY